MNEEPGTSSEAPAWQYRHPTEAEKAEWVRRFQESNVSLREFTFQNDVETAGFEWLKTEDVIYQLVMLNFRFEFEFVKMRYSMFVFTLFLFPIFLFSYFFFRSIIFSN